MREFMTVHPSHFGCVKSSILTRLKQMYINSSCPNLGIGIKISDVSIGPSVIDPNRILHHEMYIFIITYHSQGR